MTSIATLDMFTIGRSMSACGQIGVSKPLPTGGTLWASLPVSDSDHGGLASASASVTVIQSLLRGAGTDQNTKSIRIAEQQWQMASARTKRNAIASLANADVAYWRIFAANKDLAVRREQYSLAQDQLLHARKKVAAGSSARIEIVRADAELGRIRALVNYEIAQITLARVTSTLLGKDRILLSDISTQ